MSGIDLSGMTPAARADVIYAQAKAEVSSKLWEAALGATDKNKDGEKSLQAFTKGSSLDSMVASMRQGFRNSQNVHGPHIALPGVCDSAIAPKGERTIPANLEPAPSAPATPASPAKNVAGLGPNEVHAGILDRAAGRTGMPASALAAIVDAEAAKRPDGSWNLHSRNPRSSAAGLGQFLSGTWMEMAERPGTWLNERAEANGWLNSKGKVSRGNRGALLSLRYDAEASINTTADYARSNISHLRRSGIKIGTAPDEFARAAYLGHHLGPGDAVRFLSGGLSQKRAEVLLNAQIGSGKAGARIRQIGCAATAHRQWLDKYVASHIQPERFTRAAAA